MEIWKKLLEKMPEIFVWIYQRVFIKNGEEYCGDIQKKLLEEFFKKKLTKYFINELLKESHKITSEIPEKKIPILLFINSLRTSGENVVGSQE